MLELACQRRGVQFIRLQDQHNEPHIKKTIIGSGRASKKEIQEHFGLIKKVSEDETDAMMFAEYARKTFQST